MIVGVAETEALLSECLTLEPGDLLVMGTPAGVGFARKPPVFMKDGDHVEISIERIGVLANPVRDAVPAEEIAVVHRGSGALLERVFEQYGIPVAGDRHVPFHHTPVGRGITALARCGLLEPERAPAKDLLDYLRCAGARVRPVLVDPLEPDGRRRNR